MHPLPGCTRLRFEYALCEIVGMLVKIAHRMLSENRHAQALPPGLIWRLSQDLGVPNERPMLVRGNVDRSLPPTK